MASASKASEAAGFLCRWALLGLVCALMALTAWLCVLAAEETVSASRYWLTVPDALFGQVTLGGRRLAHANAVALPAREHRSPWLMVRVDGFHSTQIAGNRPLCWFALPPTLPGGRLPILLTGLPYGPAADSLARGTLIVVAPSQRVLLFDARLAGEGGRQWPALAEAIEAARRHGLVAVCGSGPLDTPGELRQQTRRANLDVPVLYPLGPPQRYGRSLLRVVRLLGREPFGANVAVVTPDPKVAELLLPRGVSVELLAPPVAPEPRDGLLVHASLEALRESFGQPWSDRYHGRQPSAR